MAPAAVAHFQQLCVPKTQILFLWIKLFDREIDDTAEITFSLTGDCYSKVTKSEMLANPFVFLASSSGKSKQKRAAVVKLTLYPDLSSVALNNIAGNR